MTRIAFIFSIILLIATMFSCKPKKQTKKDTAEPQKAELQETTMTIHAAVFMGNENELKKHIANKADLNVRDQFGSTPLNIACTFGKAHIAKILIDAGADVNALNADKGTALHTASFFCRNEIVAMLLKANAKKDIVNQYGSTPLQSVQAPWKTVKPIYQQLAKDLGALGLRLDFDRLKKQRPEIAKMLSE
ncbi:ankyrin repeat domain-containing protein [Prolixibacteraceae bacterium JC049]|nr:ankyrin repeat domain-containing protein [Prolixibacteraceae bacterium JC049]